MINTEIKENRASKLHLETIEKDEIKEDSNEEVFSVSSDCRRAVVSLS